MKTSSFSAPWDTGVKLLTMLVSSILGYYILSFLHHRTQLSEADFLIRLVLPLFLLGLGLAFMVTGYSVDYDGIVIHRLFWHRHIRRVDIADVACLPSLLGAASDSAVFGAFAASQASPIPVLLDSTSLRQAGAPTELSSLGVIVCQSSFHLPTQKHLFKPSVTLLPTWPNWASQLRGSARHGN